MDVNVPFLQNLRLDAEVCRVRLDVLVGNRRRLLHHVTEVARHRQVAFARRRNRLNEKDFPTYRRPCQAGGNTNRAFVQRGLLLEHRGVKDGDQILLRDFFRQLARLYELRRTVTDHLRNGALQRADTCLTGIVTNDAFDDLITELQRILFQTIFFQLFGYQMLFGDIQLLLQIVARNVDNLHTVNERGRDGAQAVGRGNEQHLRQVVTDFEIVVVKREVLFGIKHF